MRFADFRLTVETLFKVRETVAMETFARLAISRIPTRDSLRDVLVSLVAGMNLAPFMILCYAHPGRTKCKVRVAFRKSI